MKNNFLNILLIYIFSFTLLSSFTFNNLKKQKTVNNAIIEGKQIKNNNSSVIKNLNNISIIKEIKDDDDFEYEISNLNKAVIVDFYSTLCEPCKKLSEILKEKNQILNEKIKIIKVNTGMNALLAVKYNIKSTPTVLVFDNNNKLLFKKFGIEAIINLLNQLENLKDKNNNEILEYLKKIK